MIFIDQANTAEESWQKAMGNVGQEADWLNPPTFMRPNYKIVSPHSTTGIWTMFERKRNDATENPKIEFSTQSMAWKFWY